VDFAARATVIGFIGGAAIQCSSPVSLEPGVAAGECLLLRDNPSGVLGMDVGGSVALGDGRSIFIFGDTFLGSWNSDGSRAIHGAVHSSAAIVSDADIGQCFGGTPFVSKAGAVARRRGLVL
jgi:hypothetical protein